MIEVQMMHAFVDPQPDDVGPDTYVKPKHWNAAEVLANNGASDGDLLTFNPASSTFGGYRTLVSGAGIAVTVNPTTITIATSGVLGGTGTTGKIPKWSGATTLTDSIITEGTGLLDVAGAAAAYTLRLTDNVNGVRLRTIAGAVTGDLLNSGGGLFLMTITQHPLVFTTFNLERARFTADATGGDLLLKHTAASVATLDIRGTFTATTTGSARGIYFNGTITCISAASDLFAMDLQPNTINKFSSGTHANYATLMLRPPTTFNGAATITDSAILHITGTPAGGTNNYAELIDTGSVRWSPAGPHAIGGALDNDVQFFIRGSFTPSNTGTAFGARFAGTQNPTANNDGSVMTLAGQVTKAGSGTHASFQGFLIDPPVIGAGAAALTRASSLKISGAPSGGSQNYALWAVSGAARFGAAGPHSFGGDPITTSNIQVEVTGSFTAGTNQVEGLSIRSTLTPNGAFNGFGAVWSPTIAAGANAVPLAAGLYAKVASTVGAGSIAQSSSLYLDPPTGATVTNSSSLYISSAPVNGSSTNYSIFVDAGTTRLDGQLTMPSYSSHVIGSLTGNTGVGLLITSSFASGQAFARVLQIDATATANADSGSLVGIYLNPALTERGAGTHGLLAGMYVAPTVVAGAATTTNLSGIYIDTFAAASGTTNAASLTIGAAPTGATNNYAILAAGSFNFTSAGPHGIGAFDGTRQVSIGGSFGAGSGNVEALRIIPTLSPGASNSAFGLTVTPTLVEGTGGVHPDFYGIYVEPTITPGTSTMTSLYGIRVASLGAASGTTNAYALHLALPTGATNNFSLVALGPARFDQHIRTTAPNTRTDAGNAYTLVDTDNYIIVNKAAVFTLTLPAAASFTGREIWIITYQGGGVNNVVSASSNVVPKAGGAAGTAILAATAGNWCVLVSDGTNWITMATNQ